MSEHYIKNSNHLPRYRALATAVSIALATLPTQARSETASDSKESKDTVLSKVRVKGEAEDTYKSEPVSPKYTAPLVDTPKSVTVIPKEVISQSGSTTLTEALRTTPGITMGAGEGGNPQGDRPFIRGFDSQGSIFVDGMRDVGAQSREIFDLESVEVSKGSGGAFNGRGSGGGGINLISKTPKAENFLAGSIGLGTDNYQRYTLDGNYRISDTVAARLNLMKHKSDVAGRDEVNVDRWGIAPSLALGLGTSTRTTISYYHMQSDDMPDPGIPYNNPLAATSPYVKLNGNGRPVDVDRDTFYGLTDRDFRKTSTDIFTVAIENDLTDAITLRSTTRYGRSMQDYIVTQPDDSKGNWLLPTTTVPDHVGGTLWRRANTRVGDTDSIANQTDVFGSFDTGSIKHNFSTGIELSREESTKDSYVVPTGSNTCDSASVANYNCTTINDPNPGDPWSGRITRAHNPTDTDVTTKSIYAFDTAELNEQWLLNAGLRFDKYSTSVTNPIVAPATSRVSLSRDDNLLNWQAGVVYKPAHNGSVYLSYSTASIPAGASVNEGSDTNPLSTTSDLSPEKYRTLELGTKWDVLDEKLALTAAVFRTDKYNARVQVDANTYEISGQQRVDGLELGFAGNITSKWQAFGGFSYLKSEIVDNGNYSANGAQKGNEIPNTPKKSASLWTTYQVLSDLTIGGGAFYVDKVWGNTANTKWVPSYVRYDAMATYKINQNLDLQLNIQNLTNKEYFDKAYASHYASEAPGRTATMALNFKY